jgi:uncharacterized membrane protein (DUF106 family)
MNIAELTRLKEEVREIQESFRGVSRQGDRDEIVRA